MGRKLAEGVGTVWVRSQDGATDDSTGLNMVPFAEGDDIPKWAADQMGDHCFDNGSEDDEDGSPKALSDLSAKELKAEVDSRNEGRAEEGQIEPASQKKADLIAALEADDAALAGA